MPRHLLTLLIFLMPTAASLAQSLPQAAINKALEKARHGIPAMPGRRGAPSPSGVLPQLRLREDGLGLQKHGVHDAAMAVDTLFVGVVPNDTVVIDSVYQNNGPVFVFSDGVLIFKNANATFFGDVYILQNGTLLADSSVLHFPQQYFYQRSLIVANNGSCIIRNSTLTYGGLSHNLAVADSGYVELNNVINSDWTTAGAYGHATVVVDGTNLGGEYILTANSITRFRHVTTLLLWHHFPSAAVVNFSFPNGNTLYGYQFDSTQAGVSGVGYHTEADSCNDVWWGLMPVNGSDVTISNSTLRTIGAWFEQGDSVQVNGLINNSSYTNFTAPLPDRNLQLINTGVQTWSLYVFDSSHIDLMSCIVGEIGCLGRATAFTQSFLLDGSGGYFWASDTSFLVAANTSATSHVRSERNGVFLFGYGTVANGQVSATGQSVMIVVQSTLPQDPVPYDGAVAWLTHISQPASAFTNALVPVTGSAWIDQGPLGSWMDFGSYSLMYRKVNDTIWNAIVTDSVNEVHNGGFGVWNTTGLIAGSYELRLLVKNDLGDSVDAVKPVILQPGQVAVGELLQAGHVPLVYPNPSPDVFYFDFSGIARNTVPVKIILSDAMGRTVMRWSLSDDITFPFRADISGLSAGVYACRMKAGDFVMTQKLEIVR